MDNWWEKWVLLGGLIAAGAVAGQDAYRVVKQDQSVIYESAWVRVRKVTYQPGECVPMHEHKARVVVFLSDGVVRGTPPDGKSQETAFHRGLVQWSAPVRHELENVGKWPLVAVEAELLGPHPAVTPAFSGDPVKQDPKHFQVIFENDQVRVLRFRLGSREKTEMHDHADHITVRLTDAHLRTTLPDGTSEEHREKADSVVFGSSTRHGVENLEDAPFEAISIEFKGSE